jgi:hypothetical protein
MTKLRVLDLFSGYTLREDGVVTSRFGRVVAQQIGTYVRVELWSEGTGRKYLLHRLLADAFIPNPEGKPCVNHKDGNKHNNELSNLEWVTRSENQKHAYQNGLQKGFHPSGRSIGESHKAALCGSRWKSEVHTYTIDGAVFTNLWDAAEKVNVSRQTVLNRCKSERWPTWSKKIERR